MNFKEAGTDIESLEKEFATLREPWQILECLENWQEMQDFHQKKKLDAL